MTPKILAVSTAALLIAAGSAQAAAGGRYAEPKQPIAYSQLNAYLKASPKQRATRDFSGGMAANTAAATPAMGASTGSAADTAASVPSPQAPTTPQSATAPAPQMSTPPANAAPSGGAPGDTTAAPSTGNTADKPAAPASPSTAVNPPAQP